MITVCVLLCAVLYTACPELILLAQHLHDIKDHLIQIFKVTRIPPRFFSEEPGEGAFSQDKREARNCSNFRTSLLSSNWASSYWRDEGVSQRRARSQQPARENTQHDVAAIVYEVCSCMWRPGSKWLVAERNKLTDADKQHLRRNLKAQVLSIAECYKNEGRGDAVTVYVRRQSAGEQVDTVCVETLAGENGEPDVPSSFEIVAIRFSPCEFSANECDPSNYGVCRLCVCPQGCVAPSVRAKTPKLAKCTGDVSDVTYTDIETYFPGWKRTFVTEPIESHQGKLPSTSQYECMHPP